MTRVAVRRLFPPRNEKTPAFHPSNRPDLRNRTTSARSAPGRHRDHQRVQRQVRVLSNGVMSRDRETMSEELYRKIIDDCATFQVQAIEPFLNGEPFMDPQIVPRLKYLRERLPATKLRLYSNGNAMVPKRVDELLGIGIDHLYISLNTLDPASTKR